MFVMCIVYHPMYTVNGTRLYITVVTQAKRRARIIRDVSLEGIARKQI